MLTPRLTTARRNFLTGSGIGLGSIALANMLAQDANAAESPDQGILGAPHFVPKAKRVIENLCHREFAENLCHPRICATHLF